MNMSKRLQSSWTGSGLETISKGLHIRIPPVTGRPEIYNMRTDTGLKVENKGRAWKGI